jgi:SWI/SNF-related matrix-associated actin-dependent regulator of chromatin subfamily A member 5
MSRNKPEIVDLSMDGDDDFPPQGSTASVVAAAASTPPDVGGPRRSARDSKSTVVWIDGYAVKKTNNYSVTEGEYIYHDNDLYDTVSPSQKRRAAAALAAKKKPKTTPQPRQVSPQEIARTEHNNAVKKAKNEKQGVRRAFLSQNCEILKPFVEDSVYQELVAEKGLATVHPFQSQEVAQPLLVTGGVMRDYQIDGLNFLWNHHRRNLGMILGDEMVSALCRKDRPLVHENAKLVSQLAIFFIQGLGKTVQTISLLCRLKEETEEKQGPSLVVCPLSVLSSWMKELAFWAPSLKVFRLHNSSSSGQELARRAMMDSFVDFDVILTTYEMVKTPHLKSLYSRLHFR